MNRRILFSATVISLLSFAVLAQSPALVTTSSPVKVIGTRQDGADIKRVEFYIQSLRSLHARFTQVGPDGSTLTGQAWLQRPNRMRFQYDPPAPYLLVANGQFVVFNDSRLKQTSNIPLGETPLGILLQDKPSFGGDVTVLDIQHERDIISVTVARTGKRGDGTISLQFMDTPLRLVGWMVKDAQGQRTQVSLSDVEIGGTANPALFQFVDPRFFENNQGGG